MIKITDGEKTIEVDTNKSLLLEHYISDYPGVIFDLRNLMIRTGYKYNIKHINYIYDPLNTPLSIADKSYSIDLAIYLQHNNVDILVEDVKNILLKYDINELIQDFNKVPNEDIYKHIGDINFEPPTDKTDLI